METENDTAQKSESIFLVVILALIGGFLDAYTYCSRDRVFANAQTGNIVRLGITLANGEYIKTLRYFVPIIAFSIGVFVALSTRDNKCLKLHWRQVILIFEGVIVLIVGFIPMNDFFNIISNVFVSFLCAMQAESFRKVLGNPFSSTMCTGNLRSTIEYLYQAMVCKNNKALKKVKYYMLIIVSFVFGAFSGVHLSNIMLEKAILILLIPLALSFIIMTNKKILTKEEGELNE